MEINSRWPEGAHSTFFVPMSPRPASAHRPLHGAARDLAACLPGDGLGAVTQGLASTEPVRFGQRLLRASRQAIWVAPALGRALCTADALHYRLF